jgi:hypothetical protein
MSAEQERDAETLYRCAEQLFKVQADEQCRITQELCNERVERLTEELRTEREAGRAAIEKALALAGTREVLAARNAELAEQLARAIALVATRETR